MNNIFQFIVTLMNLERGIITREINCANEESAKFICEGMFPNMRVIDISKKI